MKLTALYGVLLLSTSILLGCSTTPEIPQKSAAQLIEDSATAMNAGKKETAITLLESASKNNPASATPWLKQAQIHFEADNYPAAIQAADEAMKRDPVMKEAKAIAVVASLRVAIRALSDMNQDSLLRGNSRSEAERLARALRETLAQDVLLPMDPPPSSASVPAKSMKSKRPAYAPPAPAPTKPSPAVAPATSNAQKQGDSSPFGALK